MWRRADLKFRGKQALQRNYWRCVLVAFILMLVIGDNSSGNNNNNQQNQDSGVRFSVNIGGNNIGYNFGFFDYPEESQNLFEKAFHTIWWFVSRGFSIAFFLIAAFFGILVANPLEIGGCRFFIENAYDSPGAGSLLFAFRSGHYLKMVGVMFLKNLYQILWTLCFIIPGIIKHYEYRMVPYLMADDPELSCQEAFQISKRLMDGQKMEAFILDLSFIGWGLLSICTCGILGIFYVTPYQYATNAELFLELKRDFFYHR
ncbi:MAG: DUF975 family protein [Clostridiales bacterium]|nr:DUF975 family protein [Clostridiales bacterium]